MKLEQNNPSSTKHRIFIDNYFNLFSDDLNNSRTIWYHRLDSPTSPIQPNKSLIINATQRIWSELYMKKKPV